MSQGSQDLGRPFPGALSRPEELGCPSVTEALVDVRANLLRAREVKTISPEACRLVLRTATSIYYKCRIWLAILEASDPGRHAGTGGRGAQ